MSHPLGAYKARAIGATSDINLGSKAFSSGWNDMSIAAVVPPGAVAVTLFMKVVGVTGASFVKIKGSQDNDAGLFWLVTAAGVTYYNYIGPINCDGLLIKVDPNSETNLTSVDIWVTGWFEKITLA